MSVSNAPDLAASALFALLWGTLADVLGTAATAVLLRRAVKRAVLRTPELHSLLIEREAMGYTYAVPASWQEPGAGASEAALHELVRDLRPLLTELTGSIVVQRLERVPELRTLGLTALNSKEQQ